jgi:nucleotide-binding universal stress UspA family protein
MSARTIVCGVDGTVPGLGAINVAGKLAEQLELPVVAVHVIEGRSDDGELDAARELLAEAIGGAHFAHGVQPVVEVGHPADRLLEAARSHDAALLVVGCNGARASTLGSISAQTSRRAPCPVVVVPPGSEERLDDRARHAMALDGGIVRFGL